MMIYDTRTSELTCNQESGAQSGGSRGTKPKQNTENTKMEHEINIGDAVETVQDNRAHGGTVCRINTGTIVRFTPKQIIVRNEHGNLQRFSRETFGAIPQLDALCPSFLRKL